MEEELFILAWSLPEKPRTQASTHVSIGQCCSPGLMWDCGKAGYVLLYLFFKLTVIKHFTAAQQLMNP
jgi:hypothetical protein